MAEKKPSMGETSRDRAERCKVKKADRERPEIPLILSDL